MIFHDCEKCGAPLLPERVEEEEKSVSGNLSENGISLVCSEECSSSLRSSLPDRFEVRVVEEDKREPLERALERIDDHIERTKEEKKEATSRDYKKPVKCHRQGLENARNIIVDVFDVDEEVRD